MRFLLAFIISLFPVFAYAQSTAQQVQPGFISTSSCPGNSPSCFIPYSSANPLPVTGISPSGGGNNGGNSCAGYSTVTACALALGFSDPRLQYDSPAGSVYTAAKCTGGTDDEPGFNNAFHYTKMPVLDPTNGSSISGGGGSIKCVWASSFVAQDDGVSIFHFPTKPIYDDALDTYSLQIADNGISQQNMVTTTITTTSGSSIATVGSCTGLVQFGDLYDLPAVPAGASITSCTGTTLVMTANATASDTNDPLYVLFPRIAPYNCAFNLHGHSNANFSYENFRGQDVGNIFGSNPPVGGTVFGCDDVNQNGQFLPFIGMDHSSVRQMGDVFGSSINIASGLATGLLGNNLLELRVTNSIFSSVGYVTNGNTSDMTFLGNEMIAGCSAMAGLPNNARIQNNRIEATANGSNCFGIFGVGNQYDFGTIRMGFNFVIGNNINSITGNQFQTNGGPAIEFTGYDGQPNTGQTIVSGNAFSDDGSDNVAGRDADIIFNNLSGFSTTNVAITGNTFQANNSNTPNYNIGFYGTGDDFITVTGNTFGIGAHKIATYNFSTETPAHIKSVGNSGDPDFQQGTNVGYCKVTTALSAFDLQACATGLIIPNFTTASRPTCSSTILGELYYDTTLNTYEACQGSSPAWSAIGSGGGSVSITAGNAGILVSPSPITGTGTVSTTQAINNQGTGTSYTILTTDATKLVYHTGTSAMADALAQATTTGFTAGFAYTECNYGTANLTVTPTTSTINAQSTLILYPHECSYISSDGTNYEAFVSRAAVQTISYQPGLLSAVNATKGVYGKFVKASTLDNIEGSAITFSCVSNPTVTLTNCHTDATCATSPTTMGTATITAAGQAFDGTVSSSSIAAGEYVAWSITAGTCASVDLSATAQVHAN